MRQIAVRFALAAAFAALLVPQAEANFCPRVLHRATRLVIVTVPTMNTTRASLRTFERKSPAARWEPRSEPEPAVVGARGIGWGNPFLALAKGNEPVKQEGDERTPAGIYRFGATFGVAADKRPGHLQLVPAKHFCVNDVRSPHYGRIVAKSIAGEKTSGEDMAKSRLYRRGVVIDYPPRPQSKAGTCILLHVWGGEGAGTSGCVALPEERVAFLQEWAGSRTTAIAIVSEDTVGRFKGCLPISNAMSRGDEPASVPLPGRKPQAKAAGQSRSALAR